MITEADWNKELFSGVALAALGVVLCVCAFLFASGDLADIQVATGVLCFVLAFQQMHAAWFLRRFIRMEKMIREIQATASQNARPGVD